MDVLLTVLIGGGVMALNLWPALAAGFRPEGLEDHQENEKWLEDYRQAKEEDIKRRARNINAWHEWR